MQAHTELPPHAPLLCIPHSPRLFLTIPLAEPAYRRCRRLIELRPRAFPHQVATKVQPPFLLIIDDVRKHPRHPQDPLVVVAHITITLVLARIAVQIRIEPSAHQLGQREVAPPAHPVARIWSTVPLLLEHALPAHLALRHKQDIVLLALLQPVPDTRLSHRHVLLHTRRQPLGQRLLRSHDAQLLFDLVEPTHRIEVRPLHPLLRRPPRRRHVLLVTGHERLPPMRLPVIVHLRLRIAPALCHAPATTTVARLLPSLGTHHVHHLLHDIPFSFLLKVLPPFPLGLATPELPSTLLHRGHIMLNLRLLPLQGYPRLGTQLLIVFRPAGPLPPASTPKPPIAEASGAEEAERRRDGE